MDFLGGSPRHAPHKAESLTAKGPVQSQPVALCRMSPFYLPDSNFTTVLSAINAPKKYIFKCI